MKNNKNEFVKPGGLDLKDRLVSIQRVTKVTKGGRAFGFSAIVVVGDENGVVGHGLGRSLHEKPEVPNYGKKGRGHKMKPGLVLAIEPMINLGKKEITQLDDGWTIQTKDSLPSAHFEHDVAISRDGSHEVISSFEEIEKVLNNKVKK